MADLGLRERERQAAQGGVEERAAFLRRRMRAGELTQEQLELGAYAGDEAAREVAEAEVVVGDRWALKQWEAIDEAALGYWAEGLDRRGQQAQVRAGIAAAQLALDESFGWQHRIGECACWGECNAQEAIDALEAAEAWLECPEGWKWDGLHPPDGDGLDWWYYLRLLLWDLRTGPQQVAQVSRFLVEDAARHAGEQPVRAAICAALIAWALA